MKEENTVMTTEGQEDSQEYVNPDTYTWKDYARMLVGVATSIPRSGIRALAGVGHGLVEGADPAKISQEVAASTKELLGIPTRVLQTAVRATNRAARLVEAPVRVLGGGAEAISGIAGAIEGGGTGLGHGLEKDGMDAYRSLSQGVIPRRRPIHRANVIDVQANDDFMPEVVDRTVSLRERPSGTL